MQLSKSNLASVKSGDLQPTLFFVHSDVLARVKSKDFDHTAILTFWQV
jgi:hypothetical protein